MGGQQSQTLKVSRINITQAGENENLRFGIRSYQGWRSALEDRFVCELNLKKENLAFFAIYDGHGGDDVALFCSKYLHQLLVRTSEWEKKNYKGALESTFLKMDSILQCPQKHEIKIDIDADNIGTTACCILMDSERIITANLGDSRCILSSNGKLVTLSNDHKPCSGPELRRIKKAGGFVKLGRVNGDLSLTRSLGDLRYKKNKKLAFKEQIISPEPDINVYYRRTDDEFIVMACDGIWEVMSSEDVHRYVYRRIKTQSLEDICYNLVDRCVAKDKIDKYGKDNMTVIIIDFNKHNEE